MNHPGQFSFGTTFINWSIFIRPQHASGYQAWKRGGAPNRKRLADAQMLALIRAIHAELKGAYGSPRMVKEIRGRGFPAGKERVERLMRENN